MTDVSQFELIYKPQSPQGPADVVLQGYFLNITNLEEIELKFVVEFVTSSVPNADRTLAGNTTAIIDTPTVNNTFAGLVGAAADVKFRLDTDVVIPPDGTAKVVLLPSAPFAMPPAAPDFEARGYVRLRLPARGKFNEDGDFTGFGPQIDGAARVLVTPQNRATYFSADGTTITDQTQSSVPTGSGSAVLEVEAERFLILEPVLPDLFERLADLNLNRLDGLSARDLTALIAAADAAGMDTDALNKALQTIGSEMRLQRG